jgi:hypothetical protein
MVFLELAATLKLRELARATAAPGLAAQTNYGDFLLPIGRATQLPRNTALKLRGTDSFCAKRSPNAPVLQVRSNDRVERPGTMPIRNDTVRHDLSRSAPTRC